MVKQAPLDWTFIQNSYGKPALSPEDFARTRLTFNLAHTTRIVACAVSRDLSVGVDVERIGASIDVMDVAARFFSRAETTALMRCGVAERKTRFIEIWTLKEAMVKAVGEGLSCPLDRFSFSFARRFVSTRHRRCRMRRGPLPCSVHLMSIAWQSRSQAHHDTRLFYTSMRIRQPPPHGRYDCIMAIDHHVMPKKPVKSSRVSRASAVSSIGMSWFTRSKNSPDRDRPPSHSPRRDVVHSRKVLTSVPIWSRRCAAQAARPR
jgi:hypothetical protein